MNLRALEHSIKPESKEPYVAPYEPPCFINIRMARQSGKTTMLKKIVENHYEESGTPLHVFVPTRHHAQEYAGLESQQKCIVVNISHGNWHFKLLGSRLSSISDDIPDIKEYIESYSLEYGRNFIIGLHTPR